MLLISFYSHSQVNLDTLKSKDSIIYKFVLDWHGVKYRVGGTTKKGVDCSGFAKKLYEERFNVQIPRIAKDQYKSTVKIKKDSLLTGDLIFFRTRARSGWHVGVYLIDGYFIHSVNHKLGVRINNLSDPYYIRTYLSGGRIYP